MPEITTTTAWLYLMLKIHFPAIAGALFTSNKVPKNNLTVIAWIIAWLSSNAIGLLFIVVFSHYIGNFVLEYWHLTGIEISMFRLVLGLFGLKVIGHFNTKLEPTLTEITDALIEKFRVLIGLKAQSEKDKE